MRNRAWLYFEALIQLMRITRGKLLSEDQIKERYAICVTCEHFNGKKCTLCGCNCTKKSGFFNKIAFPTERCPDDPPRWVEIELPQ
jgi:hypothetical protein